MKKQTLLFIPLLCLLFSACKKHPVTVPVNERYVSKTIHYRPADTVTTSYAYDNQKRIRLIATDKGRETLITYNGDELASIRYTEENLFTLLEIQYNNGKPASGVYRTYLDGLLKHKYFISYVMLGNLVKEIILKDSDNGNVAQKFTFSYTGNNIVKVDHQQAGVPDHQEVYSYGDNKSIVYNARFKYAVDPYRPDLFSTNEIKKITISTGNSAYEVNHSYSFDLYGYPHKANISQKDIPGGQPIDSRMDIFYQ